MSAFWITSPPFHNGLMCDPFGPFWAGASQHLLNETFGHILSPPLLLGWYYIARGYTTMTGIIVSGSVSSSDNGRIKILFHFATFLAAIMALSMGSGE